MAISDIVTKPTVALLACILLAPVAAWADDYPRLLWRVAEDELKGSPGVVDVGVDDAHTVYLLDARSREVRRIGLDGKELPPLVRSSARAGRIQHPLLVAAIPAGGAIVVQDAGDPAICLLPARRAPCVPPDLDLIREQFGSPDFVGTARIDATGRLYVVASTAAPTAHSGRRGSDTGRALSVFAIAPGDRRPTVLFTNSKRIGDQRAVRFQPDADFYPLRCWDVDANGRVIFADPSGKYSVMIGHPIDGGTVLVDLPLAGGDEQALERRAKAENVSPRRYPHIVDVQWLSNDRFLVKPTATIRGRKLVPGGVVEIFDPRGRSYGRHVITRDYNPDRDAVFIRGSVLVLVRGGVQAMKANMQMESIPVGAQEDAMVIEAYDLTPQ